MKYKCTKDQTYGAKGIKGLLRNTKRKFITGLPLHLSFHTKSLEVYAGVTWAQCFNDPVEHSEKFAIQVLGLELQAATHIINRLYENSRLMFGIPVSYYEEERNEGDNRSKIMYKEVTFSGAKMLSCKEPGRFRLHFREGDYHGTDLTSSRISLFDTFILQNLDAIKFDYFKIPKLKEGRFWSLHPAMVNGG